MDNVPWEDHQPTEYNEPSSDPLPLVRFQDKGKEFKEAPESESATTCSENVVPSVDIPSSSLVLQTLEELKKENTVFKERLDKKDDKCKEIKGMSGKLED